MKFLDYITIGDIIFLPKKLDKYDTIRYIVTNAACFKSKNWTGKAEDAILGILQREELGTTAIGRGVAIPHTRSQYAHEIVAAVGHSSDGVEFCSLDGEPVHVIFLWASPIFLWASPPDALGKHLEYMEYISRVANYDPFVRFYRQATSPDDILQLLEEFDNWQV